MTSAHKIMKICTTLENFAVASLPSIHITTNCSIVALYFVRIFLQYSCNIHQQHSIVMSDVVAINNFPRGARQIFFIGQQNFHVNIFKKKLGHYFLYGFAQYFVQNSNISLTKNGYFTVPRKRISIMI